MCTPLVTYETPPTYFRTGKITSAFQVRLHFCMPACTSMLDNVMSALLPSPCVLCQHATLQMFL